MGKERMINSIWSMPSMWELRLKNLKGFCSKNLCLGSIGYKVQRHVLSCLFKNKNSLSFLWLGMQTIHVFPFNYYFLLQMATFLEHICNNQGMVDKHVFSNCCNINNTARHKCFLLYKKDDEGHSDIFQIPNPEQICEMYKENQVSVRGR